MVLYEGQIVTVSKTKVLNVNNKVNTELTIINNIKDEVQENVYIGRKIKSDGDSKSEVKTRITKEIAAFGSHQ